MRRKVSDRSAWLVVFGAALIVRALFCLTIPLFNLDIGPNRSDFYTSTDGYIDLAINWVEHGTYAFAPGAAPTAYRAPAYPAALAISYAILRDPAPSILLINCLASAAACATGFIVGRRLLGDRVTLPWAAPIVLFPLSIYYCASSFSDTFLTFTIAVYALALIYLLQTPRPATSFAAALAFAAAALTKAVVLPVPLIMLAYALLRRRVAARYVAAAVILGYAFVGGWTIRNYRVTGAVVPVTGGAGFNALLGNFMIERGGDCDASLKYARRAAAAHMATHRDTPIDLSALDTDGHLDVPRDIDTAYGAAAVAMYRAQPTLLMRKLAINSARFWYFSSSRMKSAANGVVNGAVLLLASIGIWRLRRARRMETEFVVIFVVAFMLLYAAVIVHSSRFSLPIVMLLLPCATAPLADLCCRWSVSREQQDATLPESSAYPAAATVARRDA